MKSILLTLAIAIPVQAHADDAASKRAEAQRQIDDGKLKGCQSLRKMLVANTSCPEQQAAAQKLTCTVKGYDDMAALQHACAAVLAGKAAATPPAKPAAAQSPPKCTVTDVAGHAVSLDVPIEHKLVQDSWCKTSVRKVAEAWLTDHTSCEPKKTTFPYTFTFGVPGKEQSFTRSGYCPTKK